LKTIEEMNQTNTTLINSSGARKRRDFDPRVFLATIGEGRRLLTFRAGKRIFTQGDPSDAVFYLKNGKVKLTVVSNNGKEATIGILDQGNFFGEGSLAGQPLRMGFASAFSDSTVLRIEKKTMMQVLHRERGLSEMFVTHLLARNIRYEADLIDQLFNSSEKRLARVLLLLANFGKEGQKQKVIPRISQETLAEMVGASRSRVNEFLNKFRRLGFIKYNGELEVHSSLLNVVLHD
jgi:CRP/FNR family transcriptional regulator, cyclic AMP receptor protein